MFTRIDHIALHVKDLSATINFYRDIFGFRVLFENIIPTGDKVTYMSLGDTILELNEIFEGEISGIHFCLHTNDFESDYNHLISKNIEIAQPVHFTNPRIPQEEGWRRAVFKCLNNEQIEIRG